MALNEVQRQACLEAMGIQSYFPRLVLPGAAPSKVCEWPEKERSGSATAPPSAREIGAQPEPAADSGLEAPAHEGNPARVDRQADAPAARDEQSDSVPFTRAPSPAAGAAAEAEFADAQQDKRGRVTVHRPDPVSSQREAVRFQLAFVRAGVDICIVNELPLQGPGQLFDSHRKLLSNLVKALRQDSPQLEFEAEPFRWPFVEGDYMDNSAVAASHALRAYLHQKMGQPIRLLLVLGERIAPFVSQHLEQDNRTGLASQTVEARGALYNRCLVTCSLDEMLQVPERKRQAWQDLRQLLRQTRA